MADFKNAKDFEAWLKGKPREVAVALAARAALRVLPVVQTAKREGTTDNLVLPVFRATAVAWAAANYPAHEAELAAAAPARAGCAILVVLAVLTFAIFAYAFLAAGVGFVGGGAVGVPRFAAYVGLPLAVLAVLAVLAAGYHAEAATPFWSALSTDATRLEEGAAVSTFARSPLWPNGQPDRLRSLWKELEAGLCAAKQDWQVWTIWYGDRLDGRVREEQRELAYVRIDDELWKQGPAIVNAKIKRRVEECAPPLEGP